MIGNLLKPEIDELVEKRAFADLREVLIRFAPVDIAEMLSDFPPETQVILIRLLPYQLAADAFEHLERADQEAVIRALGNDEVARLLNEVEPDDRTAIFEELPPAMTQRLIDLLSPKERAASLALLGYPEGSIARRMTPEYVAVNRDWTVGRVLEHLRQVGKEREALNQLYVIGPGGRLQGVVDLRHLVTSQPDIPLAEIFDAQVVSLKALEDQEGAVSAFRKYDRAALPVVDSQGVLVGVVTVDDILDVAEEETTEDIQKMAGMEALDAPYLASRLGELIRKRGGWLVVLFFGQMLTASAMGYYETELQQAIVLALFVPLIISSGGNSGSQAATLIIRALATQDVRAQDWLRVLRREAVTSLALGTGLAVIGLMRVALWPGRERLYGDHYFLVGVTVAISLIGVVVFGSLVGAMLPFIFRKLKLDPAVCSAPFVATLVDVTGLIIYFTVAQQVLKGTLL
jgi:magnesium transporter